MFSQCFLLKADCWLFILACQTLSLKLKETFLSQPLFLNGLGGRQCMEMDFLFFPLPQFGATGSALSQGYYTQRPLKHFQSKIPLSFPHPSKMQLVCLRLCSTAKLELYPTFKYLCSDCFALCCTVKVIMNEIMLFFFNGVDFGERSPHLGQ